ncbi:hypothetical protein BOX15_Mlig033595g2, partial [Macrostomum lignano]
LASRYSGLGLLQLPAPMADARPALYASQLKQVAVSKLLIDGSKFICWTEDSTGPQAVTLKVDPKGHVLYWRDGSGEIECLEIAWIRDTRTGRSARIPKETKIREACGFFGSSEALIEDRTVTISYGLDLVNIQWINFVAASKNVAQEWSSQLFRYATNSFVNNPSFYDMLERSWTKLSVSRDADNLIALKTIYKLFAHHKDDKKRVEKALETCCLLTAKKDSVDAKEFTFDAFLRFYTCLCPRTDIDQICIDLNPACKTQPVPYITKSQVIWLLNEKQRDPRLNEIIYPYANEAKARELIAKFEPDNAFVEKDQLSSRGLHAYLISTDNNVVPLEKLDLSQDMEQPLAHYFINSSHNTYLSGHQLTGKSSVELYRQVLLTGCRCVELDCWDGKGAEEEPIITHGYTMCSEVPFRETMEAIAESAFKVSDYPVILSFENHCSPKQQAKMVKLIKDYLGDRLLSQPLDSHPLKPGVPLPSPQSLRGKFLIKNKKRDFKKSAKQSEPSVEYPISHQVNVDMEDLPVARDAAAAALSGQAAEEFPYEDEEDPELRKLREEAGEVKEEKPMMAKEPVMLSEISALVNYIEPAPFYSFEYALKKNVSYECCSIAETNATNLLKESPEDFVNFNKRQLSRIYPKGTRVDSSNYMPQLFWNAGCQMVALNFQTPDLGLQLNMGIFQYQKSCGYLLKPEFMRRSDRRFDPFSESTVDGIVANSLSLRVISGYFLSERRVGTFVELEMFGLPADTVRRRFRTRTVPGNGINPVYSQEPFVFKKVVLPQLAAIRIAACEESGRVIGQRILPVDSLRPGYRHIPLFSDFMQPLSLATLFVCISVNDYVSNAFAELAAALANPIHYLSQKDKHQQQLMVLTDDFDAESHQEHWSEAPMSLATSIPATAAPELPDSGVGSSASAGDQQLLSAVEAPGQQGGPTTPRSAARGILAAQRFCAAEAAAAAAVSSATPTAPSTPTSSPGALFAAFAFATGGCAGAGGGSKPTAMLQETATLKKPSLEDLLADKKYKKLLHRCEKELQALVKKHQKETMLLQAKHRLSQPRRYSSDENLRSGRMAVTAATAAASRPPRTVEQAAEARLQAEQQRAAELELRTKQLESLRAQLERSLAAAVAASEKQLEALRQHELATLKKSQERQRNLEGRELTRLYKDKAELKEVRKEFQQKQISAAVLERQAMDSLHRRRDRELSEHNDRLKSEVERFIAELAGNLEAGRSAHQLENQMPANSTSTSALMAASAAAAAGPSPRLGRSGATAGKSLPCTPHHRRV